MRVIAWGLFGLVGCAVTRVDGAIGGQTVEVDSATFVELPALFGEEGAILVWLLPGPTACGSMSRWLAVSETSRDPAELTAQWNGTFPSAFWEVDLVLRVADPSTSTQGAWLTGTAWNQETESANQAYAEIHHHLRARDETYFSGVVEDPDAWAERWYSHLGLLQIDAHQPGARLAGTFTTEAADPETGARAGELVIRFNAEHCADVEALLTEGGS